MAIWQANFIKSSLYLNSVSKFSILVLCPNPLSELSISALDCKTFSFADKFWLFTNLVWFDQFVEGHLVSSVLISPVLS